jgi:hypothetical protein
MEITMKNKALLASIFLSLAGVASAAWMFTAILTSGTITTNHSYVLDVNTIPSDSSISRLSAQAVYAISGSTAAYTGNVSMAWLASNDGVNYNTLPVSSATYLASAATTTATSTSWDFGNFNYRYIELSVIAPSSGTLSLAVTLNGKR